MVTQEMSGLEDLYREIILDHYRSPRNRGELPTPPAQRAEGFNPLCGDEVVVYVQVDDGVLSDIRIAGQGCSISQSSASLMSAAVKGKPLSEVRELIDTFKTMMSIHRSSLAGQGEALGDDEATARGDAAAHDEGAVDGAALRGAPSSRLGDALGTASSTDTHRTEPREHDDEVKAVDPESLGELAALQGVVKFPVRIKCATLSWNTLAQSLDEADTRRPADTR